MTVLARLKEAVLRQCREINHGFGMMYGQFEPGERDRKKGGNNDV